MPNTLEENVNRVKAAKTAIANAITAKGGTVSSGDGLEDFASDIGTIPSGGGGGSSNDDVRFLDYDGTIVQSYSATDFANLSAMPANPTHTGLTAQGWNWTLSDAKSYVKVNGKLDIGQTYITSDGKTRLYINLLDDYKSPTLKLYLKANSEVDVDWGDGSSHSTLSSTSAGYQSETHSYAVSGDYIIVITVVSGGFEIQSDSTSFSLLKGNDSTSNKNYRESLFNIEIGSSVTSIGTYAFQNCYSLTSITIPSSVTSIGDNTFYNCYTLLYIYYLGADLPTGSPWGAPNTHVKVRMLRHNNYTSAVNEVSSGTALTTSVTCTVGDLIIATFENLGGEYTLPSGWTLLGDSGQVTTGGYTQRTGMAYKNAEATTENFTLTQASSGRMFTNLIAITGASIGTFSGFTKNETNNTITVTKPQGLTIWAVSTMWWGSKWEVTPMDDKSKVSNNRCENFLDQSDDTTVTFTTDTTQPAGGLAYTSLTITGINNFWYYDEPQT